MRNPHYLTLSRHHIYYFRYPVPQSCGYSAQREIRVSLHTRCPQQALRISRVLAYHGDNLTDKITATKMGFQDVRDALLGYFPKERGK